MRSIQLQSPLVYFSSELKHSKQLQTHKLPTWFSSCHEPARLGTFQRKKLRFSLQVRTKAMMDGGSSSIPIVLGLTSPAKSLDLSTFLQTSVLLLVMYWISNFVVPDLVSKYFQFDKVNENEKKRDDDNV
ncbi:hypothetical protein TorRG33x02_122750 [Trema orientale]|uniref:Uncharacterized protein n=1 Tax=Trema orientale TaxID=63057 RepID=A0A2P5F2C4_TREOI|nr:hypothetical protein TorRG33x02_122750 [Trema orientale]